MVDHCGLAKRAETTLNQNETLHTARNWKYTGAKMSTSYRYTYILFTQLYHESRIALEVL